MNPPIVTKKDIILTIIFSLMIVGFVFVSQINDNRTKIVFCDVGQGDGAYIRIKNKIDVLIDAGPDKKVLSCLGRYMPFYDRTIEFVIISHPQKDHFGGLDYVIDRYHVNKILLTAINNPNKAFKRLKQKISTQKIRVEYPKKGSELQIFNDRLIFLWPVSTCFSDLNDCCLIVLLVENNFNVLFSADSSSSILNYLNIKTVDILKVPHHGSKNGLTKKFLQLTHPKIAVISVGKNSYGHPAKKIIQMLQNNKVKVKRTDVERDIVFRLD